MTKSSMGRMARRKGAKAERDVTRLLSNWTGRLIQRKLGAARAGGSDTEWDGWSIEIKNQARLNIPKWWFQTVTQAFNEGNKPLLVWKRAGSSHWDCLWVDERGEKFITTLIAWYDFHYDVRLGKD